MKDIKVVKDRIEQFKTSDSSWEKIGDPNYGGVYYLMRKKTGEISVDYFDKEKGTIEAVEI